MKQYYSCLDTAYVKYVPQPLQHLANADKARKLGGSVAFYTSEDFASLASQGVIRSKLEERTEGINGVIFFTLRQFFYSGNLNIEFLRYILDLGYEIHFARENITIDDRQALDAMFPLLYATQYVSRRDESPEVWQPVWNWMSKNPGRKAAV